MSDTCRDLICFTSRIVKTFWAPCYVHSTGLWLAVVTMAMKVALGGGWRVYLRPEQTQKESGVTVINVLAETETVVVFRSTASPNTQMKTSLIMSL